MPSGLKDTKVEPRPTTTGWVTSTFGTLCPARYMPLVEPRSVIVSPWGVMSIRAWCLETSGSSRTMALSGARPIVPEVTLKDFTVWCEEGKAPELADCADGALGGMGEWPGAAPGTVA
ncbi:hypothetical protein ACSL103130_13015 [Actinomyces slackii]